MDDCRRRRGSQALPLDTLEKRCVRNMATSQTSLSQLISWELIHLATFRMNQTRKTRKTQDERRENSSQLDVDTIYIDTFIQAFESQKQTNPRRRSIGSNIFQSILLPSLQLPPKLRLSRKPSQSEINRIIPNPALERSLGTSVPSISLTSIILVTLSNSSQSEVHRIGFL